MRIALFSLLACVLSTVASASMGALPILHVEPYRSPSAKWQLEVDPTNRSGSGPGRYRMTMDGKDVWQTEHPFTLQDAEVTDAGLTAGYAYSHGMAGSGKRGPGTLNAIIIDREGKVVLNDAVKRDDARFPGGMPGPLANGIVVHPQADRFILRVKSNFQESWRVYQLSTGRMLDTIALRIASHAPEGARYLLDARPLAGVPLVLLHWWFHDAGQSGALFALVDFKGRRVWSRELPQDYIIFDDEAAEGDLHEQIRRDGGILSTGESGHFEIRLVADGQRAKFKVEPDPAAATGWKVATLSREKYQPPPEVKPVPAVPAPPLKLIGSFRLQDPPATGAIRDILEFEVDGEGRLGFIRRETTNPMSFVLVDRDARVVAEIDLPIAEKAQAHLAWLGGSRWILTASSSADGGKTEAWWLDVVHRSITRIEGFECPRVNAVEGIPDAGFVVLASRDQKFSSTSLLIAFDGKGKKRWDHEERGGEGEAELFSPEDITVTSRKEIAVVDNIRHTVQLFDADGAHRRTIDLEKAWKREPNYPSGIAPDAGGGFIVHDFDGKPPFVRMRPDGVVAGELAPKRRDGRTVDAGTGLRAAPDGSLWACDGESFLQLSDVGVVFRDIGSTADDSKLGDITALACDARGNLHAVDRRTGAVHVFGPDGAKLRVCKPAKDDFTGDLHSTHLAVSGDGSVFLRMEEDEKGERYLEFSPDGARRGVKRLGLDDITEEWFVQPATGNLLVLGHEAAFLVDPSGKLLQKIDRQADRRWFENLSGAAFASDGSFVIHSTARGDSENIVTFFTAEGTPVRTCKLENAGFAMLGGYTGRVLFMAGKDGVRIHDREGKVVGIVPQPGWGFSHFPARDGTELRVVDHRTRTVGRYRLPE